MKRLLVIIDMVNGFVKEGNLSDKKINKITPFIISHIEEFISSGEPIITFRDSHSLDDPEMKDYPLHCLKGTYESLLIDELTPYKKYFFDIEKNTTNGFETSAFKEYISKNYFDEVYVTGCCTDICVETFADSLFNYINKNNLQTKIIVLENCVYTFDSNTHNAFKCHQEALDRLKAKGNIVK